MIPGRSGSARALLRRLAVASVVALASWSGAAADSSAGNVPDDAIAISRGKALYLEGLLPSGQPVLATGVNGIELRGKDAACVTCHRRSGQGTSEGRSVVRALTPLFAETPSGTSLRARPVGEAAPRVRYTATTLATTLRTGVDAAGRPLGGLMPRYELDEASAGALARYLGWLASAPVPGLSPTAIRLATVVLPDADPAAAEAMLSVLRAFVADKNGGTRSEARRRRTGSEWMYQGFRTWELDIWKLDGAPEEWAAQLERRYRENPVFALVSGIGARQWQPVEAFCQRFEIPCVLPNAPAPPDPGMHSVYFTAGSALEGAVLAGHLSGSRTGEPVVQVYRTDPYGRRAASALRSGLGERPLVDVPVDDGADATKRLRAALPSIPSRYTLVLWLEGATIGSMVGDGALLAGASAIYASASLATPDAGSPGPPGKVRLVYPFDLPEVREPRIARARAWFKARAIASTHEAIQANTFFAAALVSDVLGHLVNAPSRDHFLERMQHMASVVPNTSYFPRISLAPGQRFVSKGAYVVEQRDPGGRIVALGDWIVPDIARAGAGED